MLRLARAAASFAIVVPSLAIAPVTAWLAVQTAVGLPTRRRLTSASGVVPTSFVVFVPAHNEASGIGATLASLRAATYPSDRFAVHVVADNCADSTAEVARRFDVEAHEREDAVNPGKGPALNWLFDRLSDRGDEFDAIVVIDADTLVDTEFLAYMNAALQSGAQVAQGCYTVRDPEASAATSLRFAALACRHHLRAQARCRLGASCGLYGNGMVFRRDVLVGRRWSGHLVEDAEFQIELLLDGHKVVYVPDAVVRAEMPLTLEQSVTQNRRWERGRIELARRSVPALVRRMRRSGGSRVALGDAIVDQVTPPISVLGAFHVAAGVAAGLGALAKVPRARAVAVGHAVGVLVVAGHVLGGLVSIRAGARHYAALLAAPKVVIWKLRLWGSVVGPGRSVRWDRTQRNLEHGQVAAS